MRRGLKVAVGLAVGGLFLWLAVRGVDLNSVGRALRGSRTWLAVLSLLAMVVASVLRSLRWQVVLKPVASLNQRLIFPITMVGYMASTLLPARIGELARPIILARRSEVDTSAALATVVVERLMDSVVVVMLLALSLNVAEVPGPVKVGARLFALVVALGLLVLYLAHLKSAKVSEFLKDPPSLVPPGVAARLGEVVDSFLRGLSIFRSPLDLLGSFAITLGVWGFTALSFYLIIEAFSLDLPFIAAVCTMCITALGVAVPTAPGFVGNFHYFFILSLSIFGVGKETSLAVAVLAHVLQIGIQVVLGLIFLPVVGAGWGELAAGAEEEPV